MIYRNEGTVPFLAHRRLRIRTKDPCRNNACLGTGRNNLWQGMSPSRPACTLAYVQAPNKARSVAFKLNKDVLILTLKDGVRAFDLKLSDHVDETYWVQTEVLWSPDSSALSLTGNPNGYTNQTHIYRVTSAGLQLVDLSAIQLEMVLKYPPCVGMTNPDVEFCHSIRNGSGYNYATFAWTSAHTAIIMAEVTPTGAYGKNLGQIRGYEFDVSTAKILRRMNAKQLRLRWQSRMAWKLQIPDDLE